LAEEASGANARICSAVQFVLFINGESADYL
jgi:hypothetical protein